MQCPDCVSQEDRAEINSCMQTVRAIVVRFVVYTIWPLSGAAPVLRGGSRRRPMAPSLSVASLLALTLQQCGAAARSAAGAVPPSAACAKTVDEWCGDRKNPVLKACYESQTPSTTMLAAYSTADGGTTKSWRCYSPQDLAGPDPAAIPLMDRQRNTSVRPGDYCTNDATITAVLRKCDPSWSPPSPPRGLPGTPTGPAPTNRSCEGSITWHPGVQLHDIHPASDIANRGGIDVDSCAAWCCQESQCVAFFHTSNQLSDAGDCKQGGSCCWLKPTFNATRTNDTCPTPGDCKSGVLRRGIPSPLPATLPPPTHLELVMLDDPEARCLDGTQGAYYLARGVGSGERKWLFFGEGKAWCLSAQDCLARAKALDGRGGWMASAGAALPLTLNRRLTEAYPAWNLVNDTRQLSDDPRANPTLYNWNVVWVKTCDGGSWTGNREQPEMVDGTPLYYRGRRILDAMIDDLIPRGILNATDVVVGGGSAGALGVYLNVDHYRERLDPDRRIKFSALPDGGFFMDLNNKGYHDGIAWIASPGGMNAVLHPACERAHGSNGDKELCMFAPHVAPFIETPIFALQAKFDAWQIPNILGLEDTNSINAFGANMTALLRSQLLDRPQNSLYLDACRHHCGGWDKYVVDGMTEAEAFDRWYAGGSAALPSKGRMIDESRYPCATCTCSFE